MPEPTQPNRTAGDEQTTPLVAQLIRPLSMADYIGQTHIKKQMKISIKAASDREEHLDHTLLYGPPGLGKTSLANVIAHEMNAQLHTSSGPVLERAGDLAAILSRFNPNDILFIDEIHRLPATVEEMLYCAMEDFKIDLMLGEGPAARNVRIDIAPFTLIGATTRAGMLTPPLLDRFGIQHRLLFYKIEELSKIIHRSANILDIEINHEGAVEIAKRSRGTPRIANRLLKRVRDYADIQRQPIDLALASHALNELEIDHSGLNALDRHYIRSILEKFSGGPVGIETLATVLRDTKETLEDVIEPYLIQAGFLMRTSRGRVLTQKSYLHFGMTPPEPPQA